MEIPRHPDDLIELDETECLQLLASVALCRVAWVSDGRPDVLPVNHLVDDGAIVFRSAAGTKLGVAARGGAVAVEADHHDPATHTGWSVVARGRAGIVTDDERLRHLHSLDFAPWSAADQRDLWVEVRIEELTGRRIPAR